MSLNSIEHILEKLEIKSQWHELPLKEVVKYWSQVVGNVIATHTQPVSIGRNNVLRVATSSAAWAQNLTFERQRLLLELNLLLPIPLTDIHFSPALWQTQPFINQKKTLTLKDHPSYIGEVNLPDELPLTTKNPNIAFESWARKIKAQNQGLPLCSKCECPTPPGEIARWGVCCICKRSC